METGIVSKQSAGITPAEEWKATKEQAEMLVKSGFLPDGIKTAEQALAIILTGRELGLPPMQSIRGITVIKGTPSMKPETMLALCIGRVPGFRYAWGHCDTKTATVTVSRPSMATPFVSTFTWDDAVAAGLTVTTYKEGGRQDNKMWKAYPANMLRWRALGNALHVCCPDVLVGIYTPEELGAEVNADGELVDAPTPVVVTESEAVDAELVSESAPAGPQMATAEQIRRITAFSQTEAWGKAKLKEFREFCHGAAGRTFTKPAELTHDEALLVIEGLTAVCASYARELAADDKPEPDWDVDAGDAGEV
jgi:hypothetical protein